MFQYAYMECLGFGGGVLFNDGYGLCFSTMSSPATFSAVDDGSVLPRGLSNSKTVRPTDPSKIISRARTGLQNAGNRPAKCHAWCIDRKTRATHPWSLLM